MARFINIISGDRGLRTSTSPHRQFYHLLVATNSTYAANSPIVVVVDALDESGDEKERKAILSILRDGAKDLPTRFRFLITSRFEDDIAEALSANPRINIEHIQDIERQSTDSDIMLMLYQLLPSVPILDARYTNGAWRRMIVHKAEGNFEWAATACRFIRGNGKRVNPWKQFETIMATGSQLYGLYTTVLHNLFDVHNDDTMGSFRVQLGAILVAREPLTLNALGNLYPEEDFAFIIVPLGSLLSGTVDNSPITPLHTSFRDFLFESTEAGLFSLNSNTANLGMLQATLTCIVRDLHFNMGNIASSYYPTSGKAADLLSHVSYACRFWADHWEAADVTHQQRHEEEIKKFLGSNFLYWLEVLSLIGKLSIAQNNLRSLVTWVCR